MDAVVVLVIFGLFLYWITRQKQSKNIGGISRLSPNGQYSVEYYDGRVVHGFRAGYIRLLKQGKVLYKKELERPNGGHVSNNGVVVCCDWLRSEALSGDFLIFDVGGVLIFSYHVTANLGSCGISDDGTFAVFETHNSKTDDGNKIFVVDIDSASIACFERFSSFSEVVIKPEDGVILFVLSGKYSFEVVYEADFKGNQVNEVAYEYVILKNGTLMDQYTYFKSKPIAEQLTDERYLKVLKRMLQDPQVETVVGYDWVYRMIGEYYEANDDIAATIENWEKAIYINPNVGVKRKLEALKRKY